MAARYIQEGKTIDYKNNSSADIALGDIVVLGAKIAVAANEIKAGMTGALNLEDVYEVEKDNTEIGVGAKVYYDSTSKKATATETGNTYMGFSVAAAGTTDTRVRVKLA